MSRNEQSSVEWFFDQLEEKGDAWETPSIRNIQFNLDVSEYLALKQQAKAIHEKEIRNAWSSDRQYVLYDSDKDELSQDTIDDASEQYYNETFGGNK